jgi:hypothetical protein
VLLFVLTGQMPPILLLTLVILCYLAIWDLREERDLPVMIKAWWVLLVFLLNVLGYAIFRVWLAVRRHRRQGQEA